MKLSRVVLKDRIPDVGTAAFRDDAYELAFEAGLVRMIRKNAGPDEEPWLIPMGNVVYMKAAPAETAEKPKKGAKPPEEKTA